MAYGPTLTKVADAAHVSIATASRALTGRMKVHPDTVRRVREAAERIGYVHRPRVISGPCTCSCCPHQDNNAEPDSSGPAPADGA